MPLTKKTDNSHLAEKVYMRVICSPPGELRVLDAFGGKGIIWQKVRKKRDVELYTSIEKERWKNESAICGDNAKLLPILDLSPYNVIDLDDYGMPAAQIEAVMKNKTARPGTVIFATCILAEMGSFPYALAKYIGCTPSMVKKCKHLFIRKMKEAVTAMLSSFGVNAWKYYEIDGSMHKIYCCFTK
jgi:tRNA G26 N,N-dimethylase Trm1